MAKKKAAVKKQAKTAQVQAAAQPEKAVKGKNEGLITAAVIAILVLMGLEMFFMLKKQEMMNKKPTFVSEWSPSYKGHVGWPIYNDHLYIVDNGVNQVKKYSKMDGKQLEVYEVPAVPKWVVETSSGDVLIAVNNSSVLQKYTGIKHTGDIELKEVKNFGNMNINKKDELYVTDMGSNEILKYDLTGKLLKRFGGSGTGAKFENIGRIFMDQKDWLYVYDNGKEMRIKIYDNKENFVRDFALKANVMMDLESMAITNDGNIYINDFPGGMIHVYSPKGDLIGKWNTDKDFKYKIGMPGALGGGMDGYIFVGSHSLAIFQPVKY